MCLVWHSANSRRSADGEKSGLQVGGGVQERRIDSSEERRQQHSSEDETASRAALTTTSYVQQERDILNSMPSVQQLRQKFTSTSTSTSSSSSSSEQQMRRETVDEPLVMPRRVSCKHHLRNCTVYITSALYLPVG